MSIVGMVSIKGNRDIMECSITLRRPIANPIAIPKIIAIPNVKKVRPNVIPIWKYAELPSGPGLVRIPQMALAIAIGVGRTSASAIAIEAPYQQNIRTIIDPILREIALAFSDI